ncbi:MAG TPA: hypothetical protein PK225_02360 [Azonexus sp.]|nr:hypothetical protein [Azonexus sp.]
MSGISIRIDEARVLAAFERADSVMRAHVGGALQIGASEIAEEARRLVPKSIENLLHSIMTEPSGEMAWMAKAGTLHAAAVEYGTGPAAGRPKYYPNPDNLLQYLMATPKARRFKSFKRSERGRLEQEMGVVRRAQAFAWWIYQHGTKAQPYMAPAAEAKRDRCVELVRASVQAGILEAFGGHA